MNPSTEPVKFSNQDLLFNNLPVYDPKAELVISGMKYEPRHIVASLREVLGMFNPAENIIQDSNQFRQSMEQPEETNVTDAIPLILHTENNLRKEAEAPQIVEADLRDPNKYPLYIWFLLAQDPATGSDPADKPEEIRPLALGEEELERIKSEAGVSN